MKGHEPQQRPSAGSRAPPQTHQQCEKTTQSMGENLIFFKEIKEAAYKLLV